MNTDITVVKPKISIIDVVKVKATSKELWLRADLYGFVIAKNKRKSGYKYRIFIGKPDPSGRYQIMGQGLFNDQGELEEILQGIEELVAWAKDLAENIFMHIGAWKTYLLEEKMSQIFKEGIVPKFDHERPWAWDNKLGTITSLEKTSFEQLYMIIKELYHEKIAETIEVILSNALTLKFVDRSRGIYKNRPNWLVLLSDPSTYKSSSLDLLRFSNRTFFANQFTAASLLSAKPDVTPLIDLIHGKLFVVPTLTEETADRERARQVFAALESIYDGFYGKATGLSGYQGKEVDTVVLAAVTPAVWLWIFPYLQNIGSRWLVYRFHLTDQEGIEIQKRLSRNHRLPHNLAITVSKMLDNLLEETTIDLLEGVYPTDRQDKELELMATLMAKLRAVYRSIPLGETEKGKTIYDVEVVQREAPGRAYQQLLNFVRANSILRKAEVKRVIGIPVVLEHSMRLAMKLVLGSTDPRLADIFVYIALNNGRTISIREVARATGLKKTSVERLLSVLEHPKVGLIMEENGTYVAEEEFAELIEKYYMGGKNA